MLNKSFECHVKVLFSCQRHFRKKGKTMIMFLSDKHFDIPFRGSLIWMEWMNCWSDQDRNIYSTRFDFATYTKAVETMALFVEKECDCFILNTDVNLKIIKFSLFDMWSTSANKQMHKVRIKIIKAYLMQPNDTIVLGRIQAERQIIIITVLSQRSHRWK